MRLLLINFIAIVSIVVCSVPGIAEEKSTKDILDNLSEQQKEQKEYKQELEQLGEDPVILDNVNPDDGNTSPEYEIPKPNTKSSDECRDDDHHPGF